MIAAITRKVGTFRGMVASHGVAKTLRIYFDRLVVGFLARCYSFPASWHTTTSVRPYRIAIAEVINQLEPAIVCEVGCGLGSILSRVRAKRRIGFDTSDGVLSAARLIRHRSIEFRFGSIESVDLPWVDVLILVNWIHEVSPEDLAGSLLPLLPRTGYLMLDAIDSNNEFGYRYKHDFLFLAGHADRVASIRQEGEGRTFQLFKVRA